MPSPSSGMLFPSLSGTRWLSAVRLILPPGRAAPSPGPPPQPPRGSLRTALYRRLSCETRGANCPLPPAGSVFLGGRATCARRGPAPRPVAHRPAPRPGSAATGGPRAPPRTGAPAAAAAGGPWIPLTPLTRPEPRGRLPVPLSPPPPGLRVKGSVYHAKRSSRGPGDL